MTTTGPRLVTGHDRYTAYRHQQHYANMPGAEWFSRLIEDCRQTEAFPKSYPAEAVVAAQQVLTLMGDDQPWEKALQKVDHMQRDGQWCGCTRCHTPD